MGIVQAIKCRLHIIIWVACVVLVVNARFKIHILVGTSVKAAIAHINELAPNSESIIFSKASHAPFISHEGEFLDVLLSWLQRP